MCLNINNLVPYQRHYMYDNWLKTLQNLFIRENHVPSFYPCIWVVLFDPDIDSPLSVTLEIAFDPILEIHNTFRVDPMRHDFQLYLLDSFTDNVGKISV